MSDPLLSDIDFKNKMVRTTLNPGYQFSDILSKMANFGWKLKFRNFWEFFLKCIEYTVFELVPKPRSGRKSLVTDDIHVC